MKFLSWTGSSVPADLPLSLGRYLLLFLIAWLTFVIISHQLAGRLGKGPFWPRFIAIWGYCAVIENTVVALGGVAGALGAPAMLDQLSLIVTFGWAMWLEWYAIRLTLNVGGLTALVLLTVDNAISVSMAVVFGVVDGQVG